MTNIGFWNLAKKEPTKLALIDPFENKWTRGDLHDLSNQIVHGLRNLGLQRGDSVAVVLSKRHP